MQLKNKADSSLNSSLNNPTDSPLVNPTLDFPLAQEDNRDMLPNPGEEVPLMPELAADTAKKKRHSFSRVGALTILGVLGIGTLLALPSLLSCANSGKQAEAKTNLGALNRSQQSYYSEFKTFTNSLTDLGVGIKPQSVNYDYSIRTTKTAAFHYAIARKGNPEKPLKSYVAGVFLVPATNANPTANQDKLLTVAIVCEALRPGHSIPQAPTIVNGIPTCASNTKNLVAGSFPTSSTTTP
jgi:type II secretory pathway pseudopilin PulG